MSLAICISTYKRYDEVSQMLKHLGEQDIEIDALIVVDGEPAPEIFHKLLAGKRVSHNLVYIPSNHANLPYQRYLGWRVAYELGCKYLLYLDDDLIPESRDAISLLIQSLLMQADVIGVTASISRQKHEVYTDSFLVRRLGLARRYAAGEITPAGNRIAVEYEGKDYVDVDYMSGGAMAVKVSACTDGVFSSGLFAMYEMKIGKGEDTVFSLRLSERGRLQYSFRAKFLHPENVPLAYPTDGFPKGYAVAYSRRMLNDNYKKGAFLQKRIALYRSYLGNILVAMTGVFKEFSFYRFAYLGGYFWGTIRGVFQKPTAKNLTPNINWWADAKIAVEKKVIIQ